VNSLPRARRPRATAESRGTMSRTVVSRARSDARGTSATVAESNGTFSAPPGTNAPRMRSSDRNEAGRTSQRRATVSTPSRTCEPIERRAQSWQVGWRSGAPVRNRAGCARASRKRPIPSASSSP
jgi:hypothetical protein